MARERQETIIDGHRYQMTMLGATDGVKLFYRLVRMLGPSIGTLQDAAKDSSKTDDTDSILDRNISGDMLSRAIQALTSNVGEADLEHVINKLKGECHVGVDGNEKTIPLSGVFELHFSGDLAGMFKWLSWGLQVQFGNFFSAFSSLIPPGAGGVFQAGSHQSQ